MFVFRSESRPFSSRTINAARPAPAVLARAASVSAAIWASCLGGCAGTPAPLPSVPVQRTDGHTTAHVRGDWNDIEAAARVAADQAAIAIVRTSPVQGASAVVFALRTSLDEDGTLSVSRDPREASDGESVSLEVSCRIGLFGKPQREEQLIRLLARRLDQLRGVEFAPVVE